MEPDVHGDTIIIVGLALDWFKSLDSNWIIILWNANFDPSENLSSYSPFRAKKSYFLVVFSC